MSPDSLNPLFLAKSWAPLKKLSHLLHQQPSICQACKLALVSSSEEEKEEDDDAAVFLLNLRINIGFIY